jgi:hypothetical protein
VRVAGPDGTSTVVDLERIDGSTFAATIAADEAGSYAIGATVTDGDEAVWSGVGLATRSYPAEYAPRPVGRDQLVALAERTGGRVDPDPAELFAPSGTIAGTQRVELARWLLLFAVLAWPAAVAVSRLAWRRGLVAVGRQRAAGTVSELRARLPRLAEPRLGAGASTGAGGAERPTGRYRRARPAQGSARGFPGGDAGLGAPDDEVARVPAGAPGSTSGAGPAGDAGGRPDSDTGGATGPAGDAGGRPDSDTGDDGSSDTGTGEASTVSELLARKRRRG